MKDVKEAIEYLEKRLSLLHRNYQFATEQAIEILIKRNREVEKGLKQIYANLEILDISNSKEIIQELLGEEGE